MLRKFSIPAGLLPFLFLSPLFAQNWTYTPLGGVATELTGGFSAVADPSTGYVYNDGAGDSSYAVILDSGSSGFLMSYTVTTLFGVPVQPGQTYTEVGFGGTEVENVTVPLVAYYSPVSNANPDNINTMTAYGTYTYESRQDSLLEEFGYYFDIIGAPIIQNNVMVVQPNAPTFTGLQSVIGAALAQTTLMPAPPTLPTKGTYRVPVTWMNFVSGNPVPSEAANPVVKGVAAFGPNGMRVVNDWIVDSGAQFTIISPTYAADLGLSLGSPIRTIQGEGVGSSTVTFGEFQLTQIVLPLTNGDQLVFANPYVFVPLNGVSLPAGLTGVLGENLFMQSTDQINPLTGQFGTLYNPLFSEWYLDGPGSDLVLYDPNSVFGYHPVWEGASNNNWSTAITDVNWDGPVPWSNSTDRANPMTATFDLATPASVIIKGNIDVGTITFSTGGWTLAPGAGRLAYGGTGSIDIITTTGTDTISAAVVDGSSFGSGGGATGITKDGPGTLILTGANAYTGPTTVNSGTLLVSNISGSATGPGNVTLNGGTLGGHGTIAGAVIAGSGPHSVYPSATLSGTSTGTLTLGSLSTNANTTLAFNLVTPGTAGGSDVIHVTGSNGLTLNGGAVSFPNYSTGGGSLGYYKIIQYSGAIQGAGLGTLLLPAVQNNVAYVLDTSHDPGFIDVHRGLLGDANDDGMVNGADFAALSANFGKPVNGWASGDFNGDGVVNFADFAFLSNNFGQAIGSFEVAARGVASGVPEPASLALLALGCVGLLARRRCRIC